ncbi:hypothetical protein [Arsukibacterium ikkense]|uniref:hypothetical protein n=1 Tax=Arsukibacterium ikkense TaxID=336831 RepID=UPI00128D97EC|nr:hypothetical protein [Arsukibacterium ikkense]
MNWIFSKLHEVAITLFGIIVGIAIWGGALFILFKGYGLLFGPSQEELAKKNFLSEFLKVNESTWNVVRDCQPSNFSKEYFFNDEYSINCEHLYKKLLSKLEDRFLLNREFQALIDKQRPSWLMSMSNLNLSLKPGNIEKLYNFLEKSAYYCSASSLILVNGNNEDKITSLCVQLVEACPNQLFEKNASADNITYPCDPLSGLILLAQIKSGMLN